MQNTYKKNRGDDGNNDNYDDYDDDGDYDNGYVDSNADYVDSNC